MKFDPSKPHGVVFGALDDRRYEQNGRFFDYKGDEVIAGETTQEPVDQSAIRKRTKAEQEAYERDVAEAAKVLAAKMAAEKK